MEQLSSSKNSRFKTQTMKSSPTSCFALHMPNYFKLFYNWSEQAANNILDSAMSN